MSIAGNIAAEKLRARINVPGKVLVAPGVYDGLSARMALALGFEALYIVMTLLFINSDHIADKYQSGACASMSMLGYADLGLATFNDMTRIAETVANLSPTTPVIADADTGYGGPVMVARTVKSYARAGIAALHLEDQVQEKRCGQLFGKQLVNRETWYSRLRAAVDARDSIGSTMLIIARTDSRESLGFDEAVERLKGAAALGVDAVFLEAIQSHKEAREACEQLKGTPMLLNMVARGVTPDTSVEKAEQLGFRIMIFPGACIERAVAGALDGLRDLQVQGRQVSHCALGPREIFKMCGLQECIDVDKRAQGRAFDKI